MIAQPRKHVVDGLTIVAINDPPPIPGRHLTWAAWLDGLGADASPYGWGETEQEAIDDLMERLREDA